MFRVIKNLWCMSALLWILFWFSLFAVCFYLPHIILHVVETCAFNKKKISFVRTSNFFHKWVLWGTCPNFETIWKCNGSAKVVKSIPVIWYCGTISGSRTSLEAHHNLSSRIAPHDARNLMNPLLISCNSKWPQDALWENITICLSMLPFQSVVYINTSWIREAIVYGNSQASDRKSFNKVR